MSEAVHNPVEIVAGRFSCALGAEEALSESRLRFAPEAISLVRGAANGDEALISIKVASAAERELAVRTLQGRGALSIEFGVLPPPSDELPASASGASAHDAIR